MWVGIFCDCGSVVGVIGDVVVVVVVRGGGGGISDV